MRLGINPEKINKNLKIENYHRVIIPVYIPHFNDYFKDSLNVFKLCIESLLLTVHAKTRITIYNNNSHPLVKEYIDQKYAEFDQIDQVFHSKENLGKINAILAATKGNLEPLITITDSDVLFKNGWQNATENIFNKFPKAGMVSPVPSPLSYNNMTSCNWVYALFKGKLSFKDVRDSIALERFDTSLGNSEKMYKPIHLEKILVLENKKRNAEAVMGCGHFVATIRREVFDKGSDEPAYIKISNGVEIKFIDSPNQSLGFLRLATTDNFAYHMGNNTENWMYEEFETLKTRPIIQNGKVEDIINFSRYNKRYLFFGKLISRLISKKSIRKILFKKMGMTNEY